MYSWYLESYFESPTRITKMSITGLPQIIGRDDQLTYTIRNPSISRKHARFFEQNSNIYLEDLDSSNGTFVNHVRIHEPTVLNHGDIIHLGDAELRILRHGTVQGLHDVQIATDDATRVLTQMPLSQQFPTGVHDLEQLLHDVDIAMVFQPIIRDSSMANCGYEVLGRGSNSKLPPSPMALFTIAESVGLEVELSELMRDQGVAVANNANLKGELFVNTHPQELVEFDRLLKSLHNLRKNNPNIPLVLEIHEHCVTNDWDLLRTLKSELKKMQMKLAFDDFGVGQSRLMEMIEAKPDIIKFDHALIQNIDSADPSRVNLLRHLKNLAEDLGIESLAECVETEAEYLVCKKLGFHYYQGYYFAKPQAASAF